MSTENKKTIAWQAPEFRYYEKSPGWYVTTLAIAVMVIAYFAINRDYFAAVTMVVIAAVMVYFSRHTPQILDHSLTSKGVNVGNLHFPYKHLKHFWVVNNENHKTAIFETSTILHREIILQLEDQDPEEIRLFLLEYLPEHENSEPTFSQRLSHWIKF